MNKQEYLYRQHMKNSMKNFPGNVIISDKEYFKQKALTIIIRFPRKICTKIDSTLLNIKNNFPKQYYHSGNKFHTTLLGLVDPFYGKVDKKLLDFLVNEIGIVLKNQKTFLLNIKGINVGNGASVAKIYYKDKSIDRIRKKLISRLEKNNFNFDTKFLKEKYDINVSWATLIRYKQKEDLLKLKKELLLYKDTEFGKFKVNKIELVVANHLMDENNIKIIKSFKLK